jgi:hypothetical protein
MVSPAELHRAACAEYLDGRSPTTRTEWQYCVNYWAANLAAGLEVEACKLLGLIMECPLSATEISEIAAFQAGHKKGKASQ